MATSPAAPVSTSNDGVPPEAGSGPSAADATGPSANEFLERVVDGAHDAIDRLADSAGPHLQRLQQGMAAAGDAVHERSDQARELGDEWAESLRGVVRENPLAAVAVALVAGVLIARLTQR